MLRSLLLAIGFLLCVNILHAKILRVGIDYGTFDQAVAAAVTGDTLQIYGNQNGTTNKRLVIIGFGYNFDVHPGLQAIGTESPSSGTITFAAGSDSCTVEGMEINAYVHSSKHTFRRCRGVFYIYNNVNPISNLKIISCIFLGGGMQYSNFPCTNLQLYNCILGGGLNMGATGNTSSGSIINCVTAPNNIIGNSEFLSLGAAGFLVKNCILNYYSGSNTNTVYESNIFGSGQPGTLPQGSNNKWSYAWSDLFNRLGGATDNPSYNASATFDENYFLLKAGSPAANAGFDASNSPTDCGIFGGEAAYYYRPSGVPAVPAVYKVTAASSAATTNPYNVTISVRSNN
jgi:hypothetical protein